MKPQVKKTHYFDREYDSKERFVSYWYQINEILKLNPYNVLEIGIGNSFVTKYIKDREINVISLDIDKALNPDVIGDVLRLPFLDRYFDTVVCYEVLEHIPYENFDNALSEIYRVSKNHVLLSLPDDSRYYKLYIQIPHVGTLRQLLILPRLKKPINRFDGQHFWEIGKEGYPLSKVIKNIQTRGFKIIKTYRMFENPYHRFFILKKEP